MPLLALPFPAIDPVAIAIGPITIKWYALAYIAGLIGGWYYARRLVMSDGLWGVVKRPQVAKVLPIVGKQFDEFLHVGNGLNGPVWIQRISSFLFFHFIRIAVTVSVFNLFFTCGQSDNNDQDNYSDSQCFHSLCLEPFAFCAFIF